MTEPRELAFTIRRLDSGWWKVVAPEGNLIGPLLLNGEAVTRCDLMNAAFQLGVEHAERTAPKWRDRPSGPGLWVCEVLVRGSDSVTYFNLIDLSDGFTDDDIRPIGNIIRACGPIQKGTINAT